MYPEDSLKYNLIIIAGKNPFPKERTNLASFYHANEL
jgi:hypothetical protein